jgi:hypothetical protein
MYYHFNQILHPATSCRHTHDIAYTIVPVLFCGNELVTPHRHRGSIGHILQCFNHALTLPEGERVFECAGTCGNFGG